MLAVVVQRRNTAVVYMMTSGNINVLSPWEALVVVTVGITVAVVVAQVRTTERCALTTRSRVFR